jgi:ribose-phosphate pyrophosphokinase
LLGIYLVGDPLLLTTLLRQLDDLYQHGAEGKACLAITHPVLLPSALKILNDDDRIEKLVVTNTIPISAEKRSRKIVEISIAPLLADIVYRIYKGISISEKMILS